MKIKIEGHSDDIILVTGDLFREFYNIDQNKGLVLVDTETKLSSIIDLILNDEGCWKISYNGVHPDWIFDLKQIEEHDVLYVTCPDTVKIAEIELR